MPQARSLRSARSFAAVVLAFLVARGAITAQDEPGDSVPPPVECEITYGPVMGPTGHLYEVVLGCDWSWPEAKLDASLRSIGGVFGHLATITSAVEDKFVEELRQDALRSVGIDPSDPASAPQLWIGGFQAADQEEINQGWSWVNGEGPIPETNFDPGYANWIVDEPNDTGLTYKIEDNEENYLTIGLFGQFGWNDEGANLGGYVVEYEATELPEISIRVEPLRLVGGPQRRFAARRVIAVHTDRNEEEDEDPPGIFILDAAGQEPLGPYRSGTIFVFDLSGKLGPWEGSRFVLIPVDDLPTIVARDGSGNSSIPVVPDIRLPRGVLPAESCGPTIPKSALLNLARTVPGPWSPGIQTSNALAIQSFVMGFTNGDHRIGELRLEPIQAPRDTCSTSHFIYMSDRDYGPFGLEGDDPVRYLVSFCDLQGIGEVVSTGSFLARGRARLPLPRPIRGEEVAVLAGFSFRTLGDNHQIREITVLPDSSTSTVEVFYGDDDGNDLYEVSVDLIVADRSHFGADGAILLDVRSGGALDFPIRPAFDLPEEPLLAGFKFEYRGSDQNLERIGVVLRRTTPARLGRGTGIFFEDGRDAPFDALIRWVGLLR